jgi:VWFA-related protein
LDRFRNRPGEVIMRLRVKIALLSLVVAGAFVSAPSQTKPIDGRAPATPDQQKTINEKDDVVKISVTLVQVDAVVTDKDGKPVVDLQKDDFDIYEDGKRQLITNFSFVSTQTPPATGVLAPRRNDNSENPSPPVPLKPHQVRRTVAIVVDDLSLSMGSAESVQYYLRKFVEQQLEPGDLVAIIRASGGMGALQQFTADKRQLRSAVDRIRWNPQSEKIGVFKPIIDDTMQSVLKGTIRDDQKGEQFEENISDFREQLFTVGMLGALNYVVRGLRELPGRKSVLLFSEGFNLPGSMGRDGFGRSASRVEGALNRLIEFANRSAVVLYAIDPRGLVVPMFEAADDVSGLSSSQMNDVLSQRMHQLTDTTNGLNYLTKETGGFVVAGSNNLSRGIKRVLDDQTGYYLIGYVPAEKTFRQFTGRMPFHKIAVKVKRAGVNVRSRGGFFGVTNEVARPAPRTRMQQLTAAVTSPFTSGDVRLRLTSLFGNDLQTGYYVRSLLHIDARDLSFTDEPGGWKSTAIDVAAITFGDNGIIIEQNIQSYTMRIRGDGLERTLRSGILYTINLPLKKPGAYQLRTAVRDSKTELIGSANQYIEVPNISKGRLVLSSLALGGNDILADLNRDQPGHSGESQTGDEVRSEAGPAVRRVRPGDDLNYAFVVYNAKVEKASGSPRLTIQLRMFRNGNQVFGGPVTQLQLKPQLDWQRINVSGSVRLAANVQPGEYVLQILIADTLSKGKHGTAAQWSDFEVVKR